MAFEKSGKFSLRFFAIARMDQPFRGLADQIGFGPAEGGGPRRVYVQIRAFLVYHYKQVLGDVPDSSALSRFRLNTLLQRLIEIAQCLLGLGLLLRRSLS